MKENNAMKLITVEEHFMSQNVQKRFTEIIRPQNEVERNQAAFVDMFIKNSNIMNLEEERIAFMDANGIDTQIIGYGNNHPMHIKKGNGAAELCKLANDELYAATQKYPGRFYGYATLPIDDIDVSVKELQRCVKELNFKGIIINGPFEGHFLDEPQFFPIFEVAADLDVPVYLHPTEVSAEIRKYYYEGSWNDRTVNLFSGFGIGWHYDTAMHLMRFILSGIFDKLPNLKMIVGHWGEMLPYYFDRMNDSMKPALTGLAHDIKYYFWNHVYTDPSGMFYKDNFDFCLKVMNPEHIMWAQDYPYGINDERVRTFLDEFQLDSGVKEMVAHGNAEKLFHI